MEKSVILISVLYGIGVWGLYKIFRNHRFIWCLIKSMPRDIVSLRQLLRMKLDLFMCERRNETIFKAFDKTVEKNPEKVILYFEDKKLTAKEVQDLTYKVANYFKSVGLKKGDSVGLFMENSPEYVYLWLGLSRIGCITALINYNLRLKPLKHCVEAVNCKALIYGASLSAAIQELLETEGELKGNPSLYCMRGSGDSSVEHEISSAQNLDRILSNASITQIDIDEPLGFGDRVMYIFTSGTTGLPKAATIKHSRLLLFGGSAFHVGRLKRDDVIYTSLPLYHGSGTMVGTCTCLMNGPSQVIRKKFSASSFWSDCIKYKATVAQYIGETCRYMMAQPLSPLENEHGVRVMYGNGLPKDIWSDFMKRFNVRNITEFYGSTEGNTGMANLDGTPGAVGFVPLWCSSVLPVRLIKVDEETGEPIRDPKTGFVQKCNYNEPGELIGTIIKGKPLADFEGYADSSSTKSKVLNDAFKKGDSWFRSGDVLVQDELGYFYFRDRKGDTFRWKGENCSTTEVESILVSIAQLKGTVVFGVQVPGCDGRAGMAVISDPDGSLDLEKLALGVKKSLPAYARPLFLRITPTELDMTGNYKVKKHGYQQVGFNISLTDDKIYFFDGNKYTLMDKELYENIISKTIRV